MPFLHFPLFSSFFLLSTGENIRFYTSPKYMGVITELCDGGGDGRKVRFTAKLLASSPYLPLLACVFDDFQLAAMEREEAQIPFYNLCLWSTALLGEEGIFEGFFEHSLLAYLVLPKEGILRRFLPT
jgi:hypothetical protein